MRLTPPDCLVALNCLIFSVSRNEHMISIPHLSYSSSTPTRTSPNRPISDRDEKSISSSSEPRECARLTIECTRESLTDGADQLAKSGLPFRSNFCDRSLTRVEFLLCLCSLLLHPHNLQNAISIAHNG